ncbi:hypothetical protein [Winogradskyella undariae]|uniref:hypothetical protein n=1 Tax=Winogradskyella undariae TaxID=1285465 RepID=UPI0015C757B8|nr:hypothetical protein [Winogradskyella undariae]
MKIHYKKKQTSINLITGTVWLVVAIIQTLFIDKSFNWYNSGWYLISSVYFIIYYNQKKGKYLTIENGIIKENFPFGKKLNLSEIKKIKVFTGDYILKTGKKELTINTLLIDQASLERLKEVLHKLNVDWS